MPRSGSAKGVNAFFLTLWRGIGPVTFGPLTARLGRCAADKTFQKTKQATSVARKLGSEVFLKVSFDHVFEWFKRYGLEKDREQLSTKASSARTAAAGMQWTSNTSDSKRL